MLLLERPPVDAHRISEGRRTAIVLGATLLVCLAVRMLYLRVPLGVDEGGVAFIAKAWGSGHGSLYGAYWLDRPPLLVALYKLAVVGGAIGIRVLGALAALALVALATVVTRAVAGDRAARVAAVLSAGLSCSLALASVDTPSELLAAVPACGSVGCLVAAHRTGRARWLAGAGLLAVSAVLIKQSFLDAGFAGVVFLLAHSVRARRPALRWAAVYTAGALVPVAAVGVWLLAAHVSPGSLIYALFGFRIHALHVLASSQLPLQVRVQRLFGPAVASGFAVVLVIALGGFWALRRDRVLAATIAAWSAAGLAGVLAGGTYWPHYMIQLVAAASLLAGAALARMPLAPRALVAGTLAAVTIAGTVDGLPRVRNAQERRGVLPAARYLREHARPGDTEYVMYARANVGYYAGLPSPYPYAWSLLVRAHPGARARLLRLLDSPRRPTWIVGWQRPNAWHLDPHGAIAAALKHHYRVVAHVHGHRPIYHRRSSL
jgi:4-amino-4-deoxy-L-arabinose transferase-like glycosyltransferase